MIRGLSSKEEAELNVADTETGVWSQMFLAVTMCSVEWFQELTSTMLLSYSKVDSFS
jgi:hypothetical protein